jgi:hypothetical protein
MQRLRKERIRTGASCESTAPWTSRVRTPLAQRPVPQYPLDSLEEAPSHAASGSMIRAEASPGTRPDYRFRVGERQTGKGRERGSKGAREQGNEGARERGSKGTREQGSEGARNRDQIATPILRFFAEGVGEDRKSHGIRRDVRSFGAFTRPNVRSSGVACPRKCSLLRLRFFEGNTLKLAI